MVGTTLLRVALTLATLTADGDISGSYVRGLSLTDEARKICGERGEVSAECRQIEENALREIARVELWRLQCMSYRHAVNPPSWTYTAGCYEAMDRPLPSPEDAYRALESMSQESVFGLPWLEKR